MPMNRFAWRLTRTLGMRRSSALVLRLLLALLLLHVVGCGGGSGGDEASSTSTPIRTLAYVVTDCAVDLAGMGAVTQELRIQVGENDAVRVDGVNVKFEGSLRPALCRFLGGSRFGQAMQGDLAFKRLGVTPDGTQIVFEVSRPPAELLAQMPNAAIDVDEGIYSVRADGSDLQRLGAPSREAPFRLAPIYSVSTLTFPGFAFSPDGRRAVFTDLGPGPDGEEAIQIVSLDVDTGTREQLTSLPRGVDDPCPVVSAVPCRPGTAAPFFLDDDHIAFFTSANPDGMNPSGELAGLVMNSDGTRLRAGAHPTSLPHGLIDPRFVITGPAPSAVALPVDVPSEGPPDPGIQAAFPFSMEVFLIDGDFLLQLTNFRRSDIVGVALTADGQRVIFAASANLPTRRNGTDLVPRNPTGNCQIFSVDRNGGDLRQLTDFRETDHSTIGCYYHSGLGCAAAFFDIDPVTGTLVFDSNCDPFGRNRYGGQIFAMRPDGTGLRQITAARGLIVTLGTSETLELVGPHAYSAPVRGVRPQ